MLGRDYTASIQLDALSLASIISKDDFEVLNVLRQSRNDLVHDGKLNPNRLDIGTTTRSALVLVRKFFNQRYGVELSYDTNVHGTQGL